MTPTRVMAIPGLAGDRAGHPDLLKRRASPYRDHRHKAGDDRVGCALMIVSSAVL
jgi:hypothetical protein